MTCGGISKAAAEASAAVALLKPLEAQADAAALVTAMRALPGQEAVQ